MERGMRWSVVVPVCNEAGFLPDMLQTLSRQDRPFELILVDNGCTDDSIPRARALVAEYGMRSIFPLEPVAGQVHALQRGISHVRTEFVAICDADTIHPAHYPSTAEAAVRATWRGLRRRRRLLCATGGIPPGWT